MEKFVPRSQQLKVGLRGYFWLATAPEQKQPGRFFIDDQDRNRVELFSNEKALFDWQGHPLRVLGELEDGQRVTMDGCFLVRHNFGPTRYSTGLLHANVAYLGEHFAAGEEILFHGIRFHSAALDGWFNLGPASHLHRDKATTITLPQETRLIWKLGSGLKVEAFNVWSGSEEASGRQVRLDAITQVSILSPEPRSPAVLSKLQHTFNAFVSIATGQPITSGDIHLYSEELRKNVRLSVTPLNRAPPDLTLLHPPFAISDYSSLGEKFEHMLSTWFDNYDRFQIPLDLYLGTQSGRDLYIANVFSMRMQALEALHRRLSNEKRMSDEDYKELGAILHVAAPNHRLWLESVLAFGNEPSLRQRLRSLLVGMRELFISDIDVGALVHDLVEARNYLAHYSDSKKPRRDEGAHLYALSVAAGMILHAHFLALKGLTREEAAKAYSSSQVWSRNHYYLNEWWASRKQK